MTARQGDENRSEGAPSQPAPGSADDQPYTPEDFRYLSELDTPAPSPNGTAGEPKRQR